MIKTKAPKDMTGTELIDPIKSLLLEFVDSGVYKLVDMENIGEAIEEFINQPEPNPFTPDQLAWMRVEQQDAYFYAAMDYDGEIHLFGEEPEEDGTHWNRTDNYSGQSLGLYSWLKDFLTPGGSFLCFADYAPLEGADK